MNDVAKPNAHTEPLPVSAKSEPRLYTKPEPSYQQKEEHSRQSDGRQSHGWNYNSRA